MIREILSGDAARIRVIKLSLLGTGKWKKSMGLSNVISIRSGGRVLCVVNFCTNRQSLHVAKRSVKNVLLESCVTLKHLVLQQLPSVRYVELSFKPLLQLTW